MEYLNDDCLLEIFQHLNRNELIVVSRVCKKWKLLADPILWKSIVVKKKIKNVEEFANAVQRNNTKFLSLSVPYFHIGDSYWKKWIAEVEKFRNIQEMKLKFYPESVLEPLLKHCTQLRKLFCIGNTRESSNTGKPLCLDSLKNMPHLKTLVSASSLKSVY